MARMLALMVLLASACGEGPAPATSSGEPASSSASSSELTKEASPCGGSPALPDGLTLGQVSMPALARTGTSLASLGASVDLEAGAALTLHHVAVPQTGGAAKACVTHGEVSGYVDRGAVAVLPFQAVLKSKNAGVKGKDVVVEGVDGERVQVNLSGPFDPEPTIAPWAVRSLDMAPASEASFLGDLDLASWQPLKASAAGGEAVLDASVTLRGVTMPAGSLLRWSERGQLAEVELRGQAEVGGRSMAAGTKLVLSQGCEIGVLSPGGAEECLAVEAGELRAP